MLSSKEPIILNIVWLLFVVGLYGCARLESSTKAPDASEAGVTTFALPQQKSPPASIQSVQLHPGGEPGQPPILPLNGSRQLVLAFDYLSRQTRQFRLEVSHRNRQWQQSAIPPSVYLEGFSYTYIQHSNPSFTSDPAYRHVEYRFPNSQLDLKASGNYLLEVYDYQNGDLLFSLPFFVTEQAGQLQTRVETLFAQRRDGRSTHQLFSSYQYPNFVEFPQFDLSISYVQHQFWGRMRAADYLTAVTPGQVDAHLDRSDAFIADRHFRLLDLRELETDGRQIQAVRPAATPPEVILRRDVPNLDLDPVFLTNNEIGFPLDGRNSRYAKVHFSLETDSSVTPSEKLYITGDFNNWLISESARMQFDSTSRLWETSQLIKEGLYAYQYVEVTGNDLRDLSRTQRLRPVRQTYLTLVYFKDPERHFDRILSVSRLVTK